MTSDVKTMIIKELMTFFLQHTAFVLFIYLVDQLNKFLIILRQYRFSAADRKAGRPADQ